MKKFMSALVAVLLITSLASCKSEPQNTEPSEPLRFHLTNEMVALDITPENTESIAELEKVIEQNPYLGETGEFSFLYSGKYGKTDNTPFMSFFAINRTENDLKNISFTVTIKVGDKTIADKLYVVLGDNFGTLPVGAAMPVSIVVSDESYLLTSEITSENFSLTVSNFNADNA